MPEPDVQQRLTPIGDRLASGGSLPRPSTRRLLGRLGYQRRGEKVIKAVRREIESAVLRSKPDSGALDVDINSSVEFVVDSSDFDVRMRRPKGMRPLDSIRRSPTGRTGTNVFALG